MSDCDTGSELDLDELTNVELEALMRRPPLVVTMPPFLAFMVIGQIQLALRHPANTGPQREFVRAFVRDLRGQLARPGSPVDVMIGMGDDPRFDRIVEDEPPAQGLPSRAALETLYALAAAVGRWDAAGGDRGAEASRLLHNAYVDWCEAKGG